MRMIPRTALVGLVLLVATVTPSTASAQSGGDSRVTSGSPTSPFSANKQNEPAVAVDPRPGHEYFLAAGANDNIDMEACNAGPDNTCPFTDGVGVSGVSFSDSHGDAWTQPIYTGMSARECTGEIGDDDPQCAPDPEGLIGTLPSYTENGLVSDGDPALAFGPAYIDGKFTWDKARLYYANLTSKLEGSTAFKGAEAIAVSRTDDAVAAMMDMKSAWMRPVIASKQNGGKFSDKEQIWADNVSSSPYFGNVYICYAGFRGNGNGFTNQPLFVTMSRNGGDTWTEQQLTPAANNISSRQGFGRSGCTVRTDSKGNVYVFDFQFGFSATEAAPGTIQMFTSTNGGRTW